MRDRLIELLITVDNMRLMRNGVSECADYLLANGVIVPPCNVGDTVYSFCDDFGVVLPYFVENLRIGFMDKNRNYWCYEQIVIQRKQTNFLTR